MGLRQLPDTGIEGLIQRHLATVEDATTVALIERIRDAGRRGYLTLGEFRAVCRWKSPRSRAQVARNTHHRIRRATSTALSHAPDHERIEALLTLHGIGVPTASAVLTMLDPNRYGVIDIRVWQLLHELGVVDGNALGTGLTVPQWEQFLAVIRAYAAAFKVSARDVERSLFLAHRAYQSGLLYRETR